MGRIGAWVTVLTFGQVAIVAGAAQVTAKAELEDLRRDPDRLLEIVEKPEGTPERAAVRKFIATPAGAAKLAEIYVRDLLAVVSLPDFDVAAFGLGKRSNGDPEAWYTTHAGGRSGGGGSGLCRERRLAEVAALLPTIDLLNVPELSLRAHEDTAFRVLPGDLAVLASGLQRSGSPASKDDLVCVAWKKGGAGTIGALAFPAVLGLRGSDDPRVRKLVRQTLERLGIDERDLVPSIVRAMARSPRDRDALAAAMAVHSKEAVPILAKELAGDDEKVVLAAVFALGRIGSPAAEAVPALGELARRGAGTLRVSAVSALGKIGAVQALTSLLEDREPDVRRAAASALGEIGSAARESVPALRKLLVRPREPARTLEAARRAIAKVDPAAPVPAATAVPPKAPVPSTDPAEIAGRTAIIDEVEKARALERIPELLRILAVEPDAATRNHGSSVLRSFGKESIPALTAALEDDDPGAAATAVIFLSFLGEDAVDSLVKALEFDAARSLAAMHLGAMGPRAKAAIPALEARVAKGEAGAASVLYRIDARYAGLAVEKLLEKAKGAPREEVNRLARQIAGMGTDAVPHLRAAALHPDPDVSEAARTALEMIEAGGRPAATPRPKRSPASAGVTAPKPPPAASPRATGEEARTAAAAASASGSRSLATLDSCLRALRGEDLTSAGLAFDEVMSDPERAHRREVVEAVAAYIEALASQRGVGPSGTFRRVTTALGALGPDAAPAVPALRRVLRSEDSELRAWALRCLAGVGAAAAPAVPELIECLEVRNREIRISAAAALAGIGPGAAPATSGLIRSLRFEDVLYPTHGFPAAEALGAIGERAVPALVAALGEDDPLVRQGAAEALGRIGPRARMAADPLGERLADPAPRVRIAAAAALWEVSPESRLPLPVIEEALRGTDTSMQFLALFFIPSAGASAVVPAVVGLLDTTDTEVRLQTFRILGSAGPAARGCVPKLLDMVRTAPELCRDPLCLLADLAPDDPEVAKAVLDAVRSDDDRVAAAGIVAAEKLGPRAEEAVPAIVARLEAGSEPRSQVQPRQASGPGPDPQARRRLVVEDLERQSYRRWIVRVALKALGAIGPEAKAAVPALEKRLLDEQPAQRVMAAEALWRISGDRDKVLPVLVAALEEKSARDGKWWETEDGSVISALSALGAMGPAASDSAPAVLSILKGPRRDRRAAAAEALCRIGSHRAEALRALLEGAVDPDPTARAVAVYHLGRIRSEAAEASAAVEKALDDPAPRVRGAARASLRDPGTGK